jgi:Ser-tRNA(Ala) deacylase AlaX
MDPSEVIGHFGVIVHTGEGSAPLVRASAIYAHDQDERRTIKQWTHTVERVVADVLAKAKTADVETMEGDTPAERRRTKREMMEMARRELMRRYMLKHLAKMVDEDHPDQAVYTARAISDAFECRYFVAEVTKAPLPGGGHEFVVNDISTFASAETFIEFMQPWLSGMDTAPVSDAIH